MSTRTRALFIGSMFVVGCYPEVFESTSETDVVLTVKDSTTDYTQNRTYVITSSVVDLRDILPEDQLPSGMEINHSYDAKILARIEARLEALGYTRETSPEQNRPDLAMLVGAISSTQWVYYYYPYYPPYWGYYPPIYYPPVSVPTAYRFGTLFMSMVEVGDRQEDDPLRVIWFSAIDGLLSSSANTNQARIDRDIDQAFAQSPYLATGQ